jgi:hypothetical protein
MGLLSGLFGASEADKARELQQKQINAQYKYNRQVYDFERGQAQRQFQFQRQGLKIQKKNEKALINFNYQTALQQAQYQQAIQNYTYESQLRQYRKSEQIYKQQLGFNELAAYRAASSEARRMQDVVADQAYQKQDLFLGLLEAEGVQMARGVSGKSVAKGLQSAIAQYGRNQAIMADSMLSANKEYRNNLQDIRLSKYGADLAADANRMLEPLRLPNVPMPMKQPRSKFQDPLRPMAPPKPIKGANTVPGGNYAGAIAGGLASAGAGIAAAAMSGPLTPLAIGGALLGAL